ncbi:MAG: hypothetical protein DELT_01013 [Desulfovibrio sp.]
MTFFQKIPLDVRVCTVIFLASAFFFAESRGYPDKAVLFPSIMLVCMMGLSAYCIAASLLKQRKAQRIRAEGQVPAAPKKVDLKAVCFFGCMTAAYAFLTPHIGFGLSSLVFLGAGTVFFGEKDKRAIVVIPLATMIFVYCFFIWFLDVSIPFLPSFLES